MEDKILNNSLYAEMLDHQMNLDDLDTVEVPQVQKNLSDLMITDQQYSDRMPSSFYPADPQLTQ